MINDIHPNVIKWLTDYLTFCNISYTLDSINNLSFYYSSFNPVQKHFIMWLEYYNKNISTIHPYIFTLNEHEFKYILLGWIYGSSNFIFYSEPVPIVFLFPTQNQNKNCVLKLLQKFNIDYSLFISDFKDSNIEYVYIKLSEDNTFLTK